jgi:hypothetical protein
MGWACNVYGRDEKCIQNFSRKPELNYLGVGGNIIRKLILKKQGVMDWIILAQTGSSGGLL